MAFFSSTLEYYIANPRHDTERTHLCFGEEASLITNDPEGQPHEVDRGGIGIKQQRGCGAPAEQTYTAQLSIVQGITLESMPRAVARQLRSSAC